MYTTERLSRTPHLQFGNSGGTLIIGPQNFSIVKVPSGWPNSIVKRRFGDACTLQKWQNGSHGHHVDNLAILRAPLLLVLKFFILKVPSEGPNFKAKRRLAFRERVCVTKTTKRLSRTPHWQCGNSEGTLNSGPQKSVLSKVPSEWPNTIGERGNSVYGMSAPGYGGKGEDGKAKTQ